METISKLLIVYVAAVNVVAFVVYGVDKYKAQKAKWRIRESTLLLLAAIGGSAGAWLGMKIWHHKTRHAKFRYGVPAILLIQLAVVFFCLWN